MFIIKPNEVDYIKTNTLFNHLSLEQSLIMREMGFNSNCYKVIDIKNPKKETYKTNSVTNQDLVFVGLGHKYVTSPTFEQAINFFRINFDLYHSLNIDNDNMFFCDMFYRTETESIKTQLYDNPVSAENELINNMIRIIYVNNFMNKQE